MNASAQPLSRPNILVVDDEPSMLLYTRTLLESDYEVKTANSGEEAIQKLQSWRPDLMLLDMSMPNMNGLQTIQACKQLVPEQRIVMISCVSDTNAVVHAIRLG